MNNKINALVEETKEKFDKKLDYLFQHENDKLTFIATLLTLSPDEQKAVLQTLEQKLG